MDKEDFESLTVQQVFVEAGFVGSSNIHFCDAIGWRTDTQVWDNDNPGWVDLPDCLHYYENHICLDKLLAIYVNVDIWPSIISSWYIDKRNEVEIWD